MERNWCLAVLEMLADGWHMNGWQLFSGYVRFTKRVPDDVVGHGQKKLATRYVTVFGNVVPS